jgi:hypothetical protein
MYSGRVCIYYYVRSRYVCKNQCIRLRHPTYIQFSQIGPPRRGYDYLTVRVRFPLTCSRPVVVLYHQRPVLVAWSPRQCTVWYVGTVSDCHHQTFIVVSCVPACLYRVYLARKLVALFISLPRLSINLVSHWSLSPVLSRPAPLPLSLPQM